MDAGERSKDTATPDKLYATFVCKTYWYWRLELTDVYVGFNTQYCWVQKAGKQSFTCTLHDGVEHVQVSLVGSFAKKCGSVRRDGTNEQLYVGAFSRPGIKSLAFYMEVTFLQVENTMRITEGHESRAVCERYVLIRNRFSHGMEIIEK